MAILKSKDHNRNSQIWDPSKECILFRFIDGKFETNDPYIIEFYNKHFSNEGEIQPEYEVEEKPQEKPEVDEKQLIENEIKERFGIDVDRRLSLKKLKAKLAQLEAEA